MDVKPARRVLGPLSDWTVPQRWFAHFYALGAAWNAVVAYLLLASPFYTALPAAQQAGAVLALGLLQLHLCRRLVETVGLLTYPPAARMHGIAYVFGIRYVGWTCLHHKEGCLRFSPPCCAHLLLAASGMLP